MRPRAVILFILVNLIVTVGAALLIITLFGSRDAAPELAQYITVEVIITATRDPNATPAVMIVTATPLPGAVSLPSDIVGGTARSATTTTDSGDGTDTASGDIASGDAASGDAALSVDAAAAAGSPTTLPENCIPHTLEEGEFPSLLAEQYDIPLNTILIANGLTEETATLLQIGQILIIPQEGCSIQLPTLTPFVEADALTEEAGVGTEDPTAVALALTETATAAASPTPSITPTITLPPTAADAALEIVEVTSPGDVTAESVLIRNNGQNVDLEGWTVSDATGVVYTFPKRFLFSNGAITLNSGLGEDTAVVMFIGSNDAIWGEPGDVITLANREGVVQATFRVTSAAALP